MRIMFCRDFPVLMRNSLIWFIRIARVNHEEYWRLKDSI